MLSLYQRELQDNVKYYKDFEDNLRKMGWKPDEDSPHETLEDFIKWMYDDSEKKIKERFNKKEDTKYKWIGINPYSIIEDSEENEMKIKQLYNLLKSKCITTSWLQTVAYNVECYTENGLRPHVHMVLITHAKPHRIIDTFSKLFKCDKSKIEVNSMTFGIEDKLNYIKGIKKESKMENVTKDKYIRDKLAIPHVYNTLPPPWS